MTVVDAPKGLIVRPIPGRRSVTIGLWSLHGAAHDREHLAGATHMLEHLTLRQCGNRDRRTLARLVDRLGGGVDAWTATEMMGLTVQTTREAVGPALDLISDAILQPTFERSDVELERKVILAELQLVRDDPAEQVEEAVLRAAWGDHPLARPVIGTEASLARLTPEVLKSHHSNLIQPSNLMLSVVGDVDLRELERHIARLGLANPVRPTLPPAQWVGGQIWEARTITDQVHVRLAFKGLAVGDPSSLTLVLLNRILGSGASSRLFQRLREDEGLTYDIWSNPIARTICGLLEVGWTCAPPVFAAAWRVVAEEIDRLAEHGPDTEEVEIAKEGLRRALTMDAESTEGLAMLVVSELLERGRDFDLDRACAEIEAVTVKDVARLARRLLDRDALASAIAAPEGFAERVA